MTETALKTVKEKPYLNPYIAGILLGALLVGTLFISGKGFGASGGLSKIVAKGLHVIAPAHVENHEYMARYVVKQEKPDHGTWLIVELIGVVFGGFLSGMWSGRLRKDIEKGPNITPRGRLAFALGGGIIIGIAARIARGCTSGQGIAGGAMLSLGSWIFLFAIFAGGYGMAYFVRKQWI